MAKQSTLELKRKEVMGEILALKDEIPTAKIFNRLGGKSRIKNWGYWLSSVALLNLILVTPAILVWFELADIELFVQVFVYGVAATEMVVLGIGVAHSTILRMFDDLAYKIIGKINSIDDLSRILLWLRATWSTLNVFAYVFVFCLIWVVLGTGALSAVIQHFAGVAFILWCVFNGLVIGLVFYYLLWACMLAFNLREYQYETNFFLPADTEVINEISDMQTKSMYALAITTAIITLIITSSLIDQEIRTAFSLPLLVIGWTIIAAQYFITRSTLGIITNRVKWVALDRIRIKINSLVLNGDLSDKDTAERLFRLADIHKQIMTSKTNTFDLKSLSTLFSQLMLPLLGLLLGNLDKVTALMQK